MFITITCDKCPRAHVSCVYVHNVFGTHIIRSDGTNKQLTPGHRHDRLPRTSRRVSIDSIKIEFVGANAQRSLSLPIRRSVVVCAFDTVNSNIRLWLFKHHTCSNANTHTIGDEHFSLSLSRGRSRSAKWAALISRITWTVRVFNNVCAYANGKTNIRLQTHPTNYPIIGRHDSIHPIRLECKHTSMSIRQQRQRLRFSLNPTRIFMNETTVREYVLCELRVHSLSVRITRTRCMRCMYVEWKQPFSHSKYTLPVCEIVWLWLQNSLDSAQVGSQFFLELGPVLFVEQNCRSIPKN